MIEFLFNSTQISPLMPLMHPEKEMISASTDVKERYPLTAVLVRAIRANPIPTVEGSHFPEWT